MKLLFLCGLGGLFLSGCTMNQASFRPTNLRNKITVAETIERLELYVGPAGLTLSARDQDAVSDFLYQYAQKGQGPLYINVPSNAALGVGVKQASSAISSRMQSMGISGSNVQTGQYNARPGVPAPVVVSYRRLAMAPVDCQMGSSLTHTGTNQPYKNFGCAQMANLSAMISDPRQLLAPYDFMKPVSVRRVGVVEKYFNGEPTATPRPSGQEVSAAGG